jgi:hypothetical protein
MSTDSRAFTDFEEGITFDVDDPDFVNFSITASPDTSNTKPANNNNNKTFGEYQLSCSHELTT